MDMPSSFVPDVICHHCHTAIESGYRRLVYKGETHEYHSTCLNKLRGEFGKILRKSMPYEQAYQIVNLFATAS